MEENYYFVTLSDLKYFIFIFHSFLILDFELSLLLDGCGPHRQVGQLLAFIPVALRNLLKLHVYIPFHHLRKSLHQMKRCLKILSLFLINNHRMNPVSSTCNNDKRRKDYKILIKIMLHKKASLTTSKYYKHHKEINKALTYEYISCSFLCRFALAVGCIISIIVLVTPAFFFFSSVI